MGLDLSALDDAALLHSSEGVAARAALSMFEEDPDNPRFEHDAAEFEDLVADVRARGILQPIIVRRLDNGRLRIRFGARRYRAAVQIGLSDAPYIVTEDPRQLDDYAQVAENERRAALQPLELATFVAKKIAQGETRTAVAARLGIHPTAISHLSSLTGDVPSFILELYHSRKCRTPLYLYRLRRLWGVDPDMVERECAAAGEVGGPLIDMLVQSVRAVEGDGGTDEERSAAHPSSAVESRVAVAGEGAAVGPGYAQGQRTTHDVGAKAARLAGVRMIRPQLFAMLNGRTVRLNLKVRPSAEDRIVVSYCDDDAETEISIQEVVLHRLVDGAK